MRKTFKFKHLAHLIVAPVMAMAFLVPPVSTPQTTASANSVCGDVYDPIPGWLSTRINENKSVYQQVASEKGVPWEVLAAVHYREFNNAVSNPNNGQGIYQLYSSGLYFKPGPVTRSEFIRQTRLAADFIQSKAQSTTYTPLTVQNPRKLKQNETDLDLIKSTLFSYNGRASSYANQATKYGFSSTTHPFEGSPYVMSKFDCQRHAMGLITSDGSNSLTATDTRMGAFTLYARLKGDSYWKKIQPTITYTSLDSPRWMEPRRETRKIDTRTGEPVGSIISPGQQIYFPTKITLGGQTYLRTEHDTANNNPYAIPYSDLRDVSLVFSPLETSRWMETTTSTRKITAGTKVTSGPTIPAGSHIYVDQSVTYGDETFYSAREDTASKSRLVIPLRLLKEIDLEFKPLPEGSEMQAARDTRPKEVITDESVDPLIKKGSIVPVEGTTTVGGVTFYKPSNMEATVGVDSRALHEVLPEMVKLNSTVIMRATSDTRKVLFTTGRPTGNAISKGQKISFTHKAFYKGQWYLQTEYDSNRGYLAGIPQSALAEVTAYEPLDRPRELQLTVASSKTDLLTGRKTGKTYPRGLRIFFDTKTYLNGTMYLRTSHDTKRGSHLGIPYSILGSVPNVQGAGDIKYQPLDRPRELRLAADLKKTNLLTGSATGKTYRRGLPVYFNTKVTINDVMYLRSSHDTTHNNHLGIPYSLLR